MASRREAALLSALTDEPTSTSDLYDRVGYRTLVQIGLVQYQAFRAELARLATAGLASKEEIEERETLWRTPLPAEPEDGAAA